MKTALEILFRDSSDQDGVQSRGAGWHPRDQPPRPGETTAEGDLLRFSSGSYYVDAGKDQRLAVPKLSLRQDAHWDEASAELARRVGGAPYPFWEATASAVGLLWSAGAREDLHPLALVAACDCVENVLRVVPPEARWSRRAFRVVRSWARGAATSLALLAADRGSYDEADEAGDARQPHAYAEFAIYNVTHAAYLYATHQPATHLAGAANNARYCVSADPKTPSPETDRSWSFLVKLRQPAWRWCLALARAGWRS